MQEYLFLFSVTFFLSTLFSIAGLGSAVALVPTLHLSGMGFDISRASGLFVNTVSTITSSMLNLKKKLFDMTFVAPLVFSSSLFAFVGAQLSFYINTELLKIIFGVSLLVIASMILFFKTPTDTNHTPLRLSYLLFAGTIGGMFSGLLGIGGGSIISPILLLFGMDAKKIAIGISFVIPFSSFIAFLSYAQNITLDYTLLGVIGLSAYLGGMLGNYLLHHKVSSFLVKKILGFALYIVGFKMLLG